MVTVSSRRDEHNARVREQFRLQASTFTDTGFAANNLDWILAELAPQPGEQALDVACGAGHLGRALAGHLAHVEALDLTPEMLAQGDRLAREAGLSNISFSLGEATALPWLDAQFDLVVCRITLHQVADPAAVVREMVRVTRPGGRIGITDIVLDHPGNTPDNDAHVGDGFGSEVDAAVVERNTRLERLRDPSHGRTLLTREIQQMLVDAGAGGVSTNARGVVLDLEDWMTRSQTPEQDRTVIRGALDEELAGGPLTGLRPGQEGDTRTLTHLWATILARRPTP